MPQSAFANQHCILAGRPSLKPGAGAVLTGCSTALGRAHRPAAHEQIFSLVPGLVPFFHAFANT